MTDFVPPSEPVNEPTPMPVNLRPLDHTAAVERVQVGWIRFGDNVFHGFRYASPNDAPHRHAITALHYLPVFVDKTEGM